MRCLTLLSAAGVTPYQTICSKFVTPGTHLHSEDFRRLVVNTFTDTFQSTDRFSTVLIACGIANEL